MNAVRSAALFALLTLPLSAFAGHDEAELALTSARANVAAAERADAGRHATLELKTARDSLAQAEGSFDERDWTDAGGPGRQSARHHAKSSLHRTERSASSDDGDEGDDPLPSNSEDELPEECDSPELCAMTGTCCFPRLCRARCRRAMPPAA